MTDAHDALKALINRKFRSGPTVFVGRAAERAALVEQARWLPPGAGVGCTALIHGAPGAGKTSLAKWVSGHLQADAKVRTQALTLQSNLDGEGRDLAFIRRVGAAFLGSGESAARGRAVERSSSLAGSVGIARGSGSVRTVERAMPAFESFDEGIMQQNAQANRRHCIINHMPRDAEVSTEIRTVRFRVLPGTRAKARAMNRIAGACRYVWNWSLANHQALFTLARTLGITPESPTFFTLGKRFTGLRHSSGHEWLCDLPFKVVRHSTKQQADAWAAHFRSPEARGRPKFKGRGSSAGFTIPDAVRLDGGRIHIPRTGWVHLRRRGGNPHPDGSPKQAVFKCEAGKWFCTVFVEVAVAPSVDDGTSVGVDRNVRQCALSSGEIIRLPDVTRLEARKRRYQRRMARQAKGSNRRRRTQAKLARTAAKVTGIRSNWAHQASRRIASGAHVVVVEGLKTQAMTRSAKGTLEAPGRNVKAKAGLNRAVMESAWGRLALLLEYKAGRLVKVHPAYTSQTCAICEYVAAANRRSQAIFVCQACGHEANADVNAAQVIERRGLARLDGEGRGCGKARPVTRQTGSKGRTAAPSVHFGA